LYVAVGRRLGYPLKLVTAVGHLFCRWDDPARGVRLNFEVSGRGLLVRTDDEYRQWPEPMAPEVERCYGHLVSLTPQQELADFYVRRGCCCFDAGCYRAALELFLAAQQLWREQFASAQWAAAAMVLDLESSGQAQFGLLGPHSLPEPLMLDHGRARRMSAAERAGVALARRELTRLAANRRLRAERRREGRPEIVFPDYSETGPRPATAVTQGAATCMTPTSAASSARTRSTSSPATRICTGSPGTIR
jgi:hypothetical protein